MELKHDIEEKYCVDKFLENRRGKKTIPYARAIIGCLSKQFDNDSQKPDLKKDNVGWVVCSRILQEVRAEYPGIRDSTFYRILKEMKDNHLIERRGKKMTPHRPGRVPVYYRVPVLHARVFFESKEEIIDSLLTVIDSIAISRRQNIAAVKLLKKYQPDKPEPIIRKEIYLESVRLLKEGEFNGDRLIRFPLSP